MGAAVALIWQEKNLKKVFYIGLGLPAFVQLSIARINNQKTAQLQQPGQTLESNVLASRPDPLVMPTAGLYQVSLSRKNSIGSIKAAALGDRSLLAGAKLIIINERADPPKDTVLRFHSPNQKVLASYKITQVTEARSGITIPRGTNSFSVSIGPVSASKEIGQSRECKISFRLAIEEHPWNGLLKAFGVLSAEPWTISLTQAQNLLSPQSQALVEALSRLPKSDDLFLYPDLPCENLEVARTASQVPNSEKVLALIDTKLIGSGKAAILFGENALYWYAPPPLSRPAGPGRIPYSEIMTTRINEKGDLTVILGKAEYDLSGSYVHSKDFMAMIGILRKTLGSGGPQVTTHNPAVERTETAKGAVSPLTV
jgi:hypothetical protein